MTKEIITKEIADKLIKVKGKVRGITIKGDIEYVIYRKGKEALEQIENEMKRLGHPIKYKKIKAMNFYPLGLEAILLLAFKKLFGFSEKEFEEIGEYSSKLPSIVRTFMQYFISMKSITKQAPKMWNNLYSVGKLEVVELNEKEKYLILRLKDFKLHPLHCLGFKGYASNTVKMVVKNNVSVEETKCVFKGDDYHEFLIKW